MATDDSPSAPAPPRRRFQFSLRLLFLITALWAVVLGWWCLNCEIHDAHAEESCRVRYWMETVCIQCTEPIVVTEKEIRDAIGLAARAHSGPITRMAIGGYCKKLTPGAWNCIREQNLKSLSITLLDDTSTSHLEKLATLENLHIFADIAPAEAKRLEMALPNCGIIFNRASDDVRLPR